MFKAHRLVYHSTLSLRVIKKKKKVEMLGVYPGVIFGIWDQREVNARKRLLRNFLLAVSGFRVQGLETLTYALVKKGFLDQICMSIVKLVPESGHIHSSD